MVQRTPGRQLRKSQIWTLHPLKAVVTLPSTTIWMLGASPWHLTSDFGNFSFFQSFLCVCESFWKILILLKYLLSETVCTFSFISRPHPLPSFPLLRIPRFRLIQFCFSEITGPLFIVLSKLFKKWNLQVHIFFSLFMPFWSIIQWVSILSGLEISPQIPQNVQAQRRGGHVWCLIWCLFRASRKWGTRKETLGNVTFKSPGETDLWEQWQEALRGALHCSLSSQARRGSGFLLLLFMPRAKPQQPLLHGLLCSAAPARNDIPVLREEAGLRAPDWAAVTHSTHCPGLWMIPRVLLHLGQTFALLLILSPSSGGSPTNAWRAELSKMTEHLQQPG